jgi:hypothetical protein
LRLTPKNWSSFQQYKDRTPPWIKLHRVLLDDYDFSCLPVASKALAPMLWLLASEYDEGVIDASAEKLAFRLRMTVGELAEALNPLIEAKFFDVERDASKPLAPRKQDACLEEEREKEERKRERAESALDFEAYWKKYPKTPVMSKKEAATAWDKLPRADQSAALAAVEPFREWLAKQKDHPVVHACRFLSQRRFEGFKPSLDVVSTMVFVRPGTEAWDAWQAVKPTPTNKDGGWYFESEYPPNYEPKAA